MNKSLAIITVASILAAATVYKTLSVPAEAKVPVEVLTAFTQWSAQHSRLYSSPEERKFRLMNFWKNYQEIESVNSQNLSYTFGLNHFSDMSNEEFKAKMLSPPLDPKTQTAGKPAPISKAQVLEAVGQQDFVDWVAKGKCSAIRSQGQCGSGYAFVSAKTIEYTKNIFGVSGKSQQQGGFLSPQEYIDCSSAQGNAGCGGGWPHNSYTYSYYNGLSYDSRYPYQGYQQACQGSSPGQFVVKQFYTLTSGDADMLKAGVKQQPIAVGLDASGMQNYAGGVFQGGCSTSVTNHFMTVVGYGTASVNVDGLGQQASNVWKLENSWGTGWGISGYMMLPRYSGQTYMPCGITNWGAYPQL